SAVHAHSGFRIYAFILRQIPYVKRLSVYHTLPKNARKSLSPQRAGLVVAYQSAHAVFQKSRISSDVPCPVCAVNDGTGQRDFDAFVHSFAFLVGPYTYCRCRLGKRLLKSCICCPLIEVIDRSVETVLQRRKVDSGVQRCCGLPSEV